MSQDQDVATAAVRDVTAGELLPDFDFFDPSHAPRADDVLRHARERCPVPHPHSAGPGRVADRRPGISKVRRELRIEFDQR